MHLAPAGAKVLVVEAFGDAAEQGVKVGLIAKSTLNSYDESTMGALAKAPFVLVTALEH